MVDIVHIHTRFKKIVIGPIYTRVKKLGIVSNYTRIKKTDKGLVNTIKI